LVVEPPYVASRLQFDCSPKARFLELGYSDYLV